MHLAIEIICSFYKKVVGEEKSLTNILTKNTLEYLAFGEYFWRDRAVALEPMEQWEQKESLFSLCRVAREEDECHIRTNILTKIQFIQNKLNL